LKKTVSEIAAQVDGSIDGDGSVVIRGFAGLEEAGPKDVSFLANPRYAVQLKTTRAAAVFVASDQEVSVETGPVLIRVANPSAAFSRALTWMVDPVPETFQGIHPSAVIAASAKLGDDVTVGPHAVIEDNVVIGSRTKIRSGVFIGTGSTIGDDGEIHPNVTITHHTQIGDRVIIHSGTVIGSDGFGYVTENGVHTKIPQIGIVQICDDVEIGANVTVDRARFDKTVIGEGTKIDNLVQIAHNVRIGKGCVIVSQVGIAGSSTIQDYVVLGGQVGVAGHLTVGAGSMVAAQSGISNSVEPRSILFGSPAQDHMRAKRIHAVLNKLPEALKEMRVLKKQLQDLQEKLSNSS